MLHVTQRFAPSLKRSSAALHSTTLLGSRVSCVQLPSDSRHLHVHASVGQMANNSTQQGQLARLNEGPVVVVTKPGCPYCKRAKAALMEAQIPFQELDASTDSELRALIKDVSGSSTVPQVFVGGRSIGGSDALAAGLQDGTFQSALQQAIDNKLTALPPQVLKAVEQSWAKQDMSNNPSGSESSTVPEQIRKYASLLESADGGIPTQPTTVGQRTLKTFTGQQLIDWLTTQAHEAGQGTLSSQEAKDVAGQLLASNTISPATVTFPYTPTLSPKEHCSSSLSNSAVNPDTRYFIVSRDLQPVKGQPLNTTFWWGAPARPAVQVAQDLRDIILRLYDKHLSSDGRALNYKGIKDDLLFKDYVYATAELQRVDLTGLARDELAALFINLYNALIVHAMVVHGQPKNTGERMTFFKKYASYCIAGHTYSADDMEHGVLRSNSPPVTIWQLIGLGQFASPQLKRDDPRASKVVTPLDPRIHFALVCGAKSCPPISVYTPDNLEEGLAAAAEAFCAGEVELDVNNRQVKLSKIFQWYGRDFGKDEPSRLKFLSQYLKGQARQDLETLLASGQKIKVVYKEYDWGLNE